MIRPKIVAFLVISLAVFCWAACGIRRGDDVLLLDGFEGWVVIRYEVSNSPALEHGRFRNVIRVPASGEFSTSSKRAGGYGFDTYYFLDAVGKLHRIRNWDEHCESHEVCIQQFQLFSSPSIATMFFVGKKDNMPRYPRPNLETERAGDR